MHDKLKLEGYMGRLKEFEMEVALGKAMNVFWLKGYDNASLKDLLSEMNILNGSFYNTFGNKKSLYLKTLEFYANEVTAKRASELEASETFKVGIRAMFKEMFKCFKDKSSPRGCLLVNSLSNELLKDPEVLDYVQAEIKNFRLFFKGHLDQAISNGELGESINSEVISSILVTYIQGLMKLSSIECGSSKVEKQTEVLLESLGL